MYVLYFWKKPAIISYYLLKVKQLYKSIANLNLNVAGQISCYSACSPHAVLSVNKAAL